MYDKKMIEFAMQAYLESAELSPRTVDLYRHYLLKFSTWCAARNIQEPDYQALSIQDVKAWLNSNEWSDSTRHTAGIAVREFYRHQFGAEHPITKLRVKNSEPGPQRTMDETELKQLITSIDDTQPRGLRDLALICLMVDTGLRASEVCSIQLVKLNLKKRQANVCIKGGRWDIALFFEHTARCVGNWLAVRPYVAAPETDTLFCSIGGRSPGEPLTRFGVRSILADRANKAGIEPISPHVTRRTCMTIASELGASEIIVMKANRLKSTRMVVRYTKHARPEKIEPYSPVNFVMGLGPNQPTEPD